MTTKTIVTTAFVGATITRIGPMTPEEYNAIHRVMPGPHWSPPLVVRCSNGLAIYADAGMLEHAELRGLDDVDPFYIEAES
jgi:hypothetical protein